jgi:hypothetical protein
MAMPSQIHCDWNLFDLWLRYFLTRLWIEIWVIFYRIHSLLFLASFQLNIIVFALICTLLCADSSLRPCHRVSQDLRADPSTPPKTHHPPHPICFRSLSLPCLGLFLFHQIRTLYDIIVCFCFFSLFLRITNFCFIRVHFADSIHHQLKCLCLNCIVYIGLSSHCQVSTVGCFIGLGTSNVGIGCRCKMVIFGVVWLRHSPRLLSCVHTGHLCILVHSHPVATAFARSLIDSMSIISFLCDVVRGTHW